MNVFKSHTFEVKANTSRSDFLREINKFGFFSGVEFECKDPSQSIFFIREVGVLERLGKVFRSILSKDMYRASGNALIELSKKNLIVAGVLGRSVFDAQEKLILARELNDKLKLGEKKLNLTEDSVLVVPPEGKMIVTDASSKDFRQAQEVDLTNALTQENFRIACNAALSKATEKSLEEVLIVKLDPVSDNDEPSDEAINKLLIAIDDHQQSHPRSRLMIATDGDRLLYERILNLKIQHDIKKVARSNTKSLTPMDLLMISAHGDELVKLDPIDEKTLEKRPTQFDNVSLYITNHPEMIQSDLSIVNSISMSPTLQNPDDKPAAASKLIWSVTEQGSRSELGAAFTREKEEARLKSTLHAARFPTMDLPVKRLIIFGPLRGQWTTASSGYEESVEKVKNFYLEELRKERGRVVIQSPNNEYACEGLRRAVEQLRKKEKGPSKIIITSRADAVYIFKKFKPSA